MSLALPLDSVGICCLEMLTLGEGEGEEGRREGEEELVTNLPILRVAAIVTRACTFRISEGLGVRPGFHCGSSTRKFLTDDIRPLFSTLAHRNRKVYFEKAKCFELIDVKEDQYNIDRVIKVRWIN